MSKKIDARLPKEVGTGGTTCRRFFSAFSAKTGASTGNNDKALDGFSACEAGGNVVKSYQQTTAAKGGRRMQRFELPGWNSGASQDAPAVCARASYGLAQAGPFACF